MPFSSPVETLWLSILLKFVIGEKCFLIKILTFFWYTKYKNIFFSPKTYRYTNQYTCTIYNSFSHLGC